LAMLAQTNSNVLQRLVDSFDLQSGELLDMVDKNMRKGFQAVHDGNEVIPPTEKEIERMQDRMERKSDSFSSELNAGLVNMICPHCGEEFQMNRAELMV
jgi:Zn finger protein HypA/HybF involved in hydrogenase expression